MSPLLLLHGFTGGPSSWDGVVTLLRKERRVLRPYLLGHGGPERDLDVDPLETPAPAESSFEREVDRIAALVREAGLRDVHVCGYSLGGRIALGLLARAPDLFSRATLIGANPGLKTAEERAERGHADQQWVSLLEREGRDSFLAAWEAQPLFASQHRLAADQRSAQRMARTQHSARGLARALGNLGLAQMPNYWGHLSRITIPVTVMAGEEDAKFRALAAEMAAHLARATVAVAAGAGHNVALENPAAVAEQLETEISG